MALIIFWAVAAAMTLAVAGVMVLALSRSAAEVRAAAEFDIKVFRDQLEEVERDLARGLVSPEEAARLRTEISRRILGSDAALRDGPVGPAGGVAPKSGPSHGLTAALICVVLAVVTFSIYGTRGAPQLGDQPMMLRLAEASAMRATRPSQQDAEANFTPPAGIAPPDADHLALVDKLRSVMESRPDDLRGQELLARNEAGLGNFPAAAQAQLMVLQIKGEEASLEDLSFAAEMMILAANGVVTPEAEAILTQILGRDPRNGTARFQSGRLMLQTGRPDLAFRFWAPLWEESPEGAYWLPILQKELPDLAWLAGQHRYEMPARKPAAATAPATTAGPTAAQLEAAATLSDEERATMVQGMVDGLMARLATEGGTAPEWAQLLRALGVLGDKDRAQAILGEARERFAGRAADMALIDEAARAAGISQ